MRGERQKEGRKKEDDEDRQEKEGVGPGGRVRDVESGDEHEMSNMMSRTAQLAYHVQRLAFPFLPFHGRLRQVCICVTNLLWQIRCDMVDQKRT